MANAINQALVTGGAGFIGSHIAHTLTEQGCRVIVLDNLSSGHLRNLKSIEDQISFIKGDIRNSDDIDAAIAGCDVVFHQAAVVSVTKTVDEPVESTDVNDLGTLKVLDAARRCGIKRVVLASSSAIYGDDPQMPKQESHPSRPLSPYAVQKLTNEHYANLYDQLYGLETVALRYFNVYGPRQDPSSPYSGVISIFMKCAAQQQVPTIYGDGHQTRDFVFVKDVVQANLLAALSPNAPGRAFNVGTGDAIEVGALWEKIAGLAQWPQAAHHEKERPGDIVHSRASIELARKHLAYSPAVQLDQGLAQTYAWYQENQ